MKRLSLIFVVSLLFAAAPAQAATTFNVTTTDDEADGGACFAGDPDCSLREAILAANANGGADVVSVPPGEYRLTIPPDGTNDDGLDGDLDILDELTLNGAGATIDAGGDTGIGD